MVVGGAPRNKFFGDGVFARQSRPEVDVDGCRRAKGTAIFRNRITILRWKRWNYLCISTRLDGQDSWELVAIGSGGGARGQRQLSWCVSSNTLPWPASPYHVVGRRESCPQSGVTAQSGVGRVHKKHTKKVHAACVCHRTLA